MKTLLIIILFAISAYAIPVAGRVTDTYGRGIRNVQIVAATGVPCNNWMAVTNTNTFGYFRFDAIGGCEMVISAQSKRYVFYPDAYALLYVHPNGIPNMRFLACMSDCDNWPFWENGGAYENRTDR